MAITTIFCTKAEAIFKAGRGINSDLADGTITIDGENAVEVTIKQVEADINMRCGFNWSDAYAAAPEATKLTINNACSDKAGAYLVDYDKSGYLAGRLEAEGKINFLIDNYLRALSLLKNKEKQNFIRDPTTGTIA